MAIILTIVFTFIFTALLAVIIFRQIGRFSESWPLLVDTFELLLTDTARWTSRYFDLSKWKVNKFIINTKKETLSMSNAEVTQTLFVLGNGIVTLLLIPIYVFLLLYYNKLLIEFIYRVFGNNNQNRIRKIISETKTVIQLYLTSLVIEAIIVAMLNITIEPIFKKINKKS